MLTFKVLFGILCLAAIAGTMNGAPQGCPNGDCSTNYYYAQPPRSTRYSRGLRDAEIHDADTFTRGVDCYEDCTDLCYPYAHRRARSHADTPTLSSFESMLQDLGSPRENQRRQLYSQNEAFPKMIYKQIPTGHSSKLYVVQQPIENMDYNDDARSIHSTYGSNSRRSSLSDDEMEEIVRKVIAELKNKQRSTEQSRRRGPFGASSLVQRPQIKYNPYNLSTRTMISDDVFEPEYEISQFEVLPNPQDGKFHIEGDVAVSMGHDDGSSREESSESIISDEESPTFLPTKSVMFDDDEDVVLSGAEKISDDEGEDAEYKDEMTQEAAVLSPSTEDLSNIDTSDSDGETEIVSTHPEDDAEIDSYLVDDVEKPAHTSETSPTLSA